MVYYGIIVLSMVVLAMQMNVIDAQKRKKGGKKGKKSKNMQTVALNAWADSLTDEDLNNKKWGMPSNVFHRMTLQLSDVFKRYNANVNFVLVGACDGTHDKTIEQRFFPNSHWRAVFIEAISFNVRDLREFLANKTVADRSLVIHAAATDVCVNKTILVQRPRLEEKSKNIAHWMRRQIGGIASKNHLLPEAAQKDRATWAHEEVRCITGKEILYEWASLLYNQKLAARNKLRPHILKIDAEGHDFEVMLSFIGDTVSDAQLPLMIDFEAKSLFVNYDETIQLLNSRGYIVSQRANDGFAILQGHKFLKKKKNGSNKSGGGGGGGDLEGEENIMPDADIEEA